MRVTVDPQHSVQWKKFAVSFAALVRTFPSTPKGPYKPRALMTDQISFTAMRAYYHH